MKPLDTPIKNGVALQKGDDIYIFGGWDEKETSDKIFKFNIIKGDTSFIGYLPYKVESPAHCVVDNSLFMFGGFDSYGVIDKIMQVDLKTMSAKEVDGVTLRVKRENCTS